MKLKYVWIVLILLLAYGLLPVTWPDYSDNYDKPNILLIRRQECGCPCAEGVITKGEVLIPQSIKQLYPELNERGKEITLSNFPPYDDITMDRLETFYFANENVFKVTGDVTSVDTILCSPDNCEVVPKFTVKHWALTSYLARFWNFGIPAMLIYCGLWIVGLPGLLIATFATWRQRNKFTHE